MSKPEITWTKSGAYISIKVNGESIVSQHTVGIADTSDETIEKAIGIVEDMIFSAYYAMKFQDEKGWTGDYYFLALNARKAAREAFALTMGQKLN